MDHDTPIVQRASSRLPRPAWWVFAGPVAGALTVAPLMIVLHLIGSAANNGDSAQQFTDLPIIAIFSTILGLLGGAIVGLIGGWIIAVVDMAAGERGNARIDAAVAAGLSFPVTLLVVWQFGRPLDVWSAIELWAPVAVVPAVAARLAVVIWRKTRGVLPPGLASEASTVTP